MTKSYHYYPYGGLMGESTGSDAQPYKYNGKELDRHSGLDWYDYGARWYNGLSWMLNIYWKNMAQTVNLNI